MQLLAQQLGKPGSAMHITLETETCKAFQKMLPAKAKDCSIGDPGWRDIFSAQIYMRPYSTEGSDTVTCWNICHITEVCRAIASFPSGH